MLSTRRNQDFLAGSSVGAMLNPKAAVPLRNYQAANRAIQKELEATCVAQRKAREAEAAKPFRLPSQGKYQHVESRVFAALASSSSSGSSAAGGGAGASAPGDSPLKENSRPAKASRFSPPSPDAPVKPFVRAHTGGDRKAALPKFSELAAAPKQVSQQFEHTP